jgi:hypothetical protein
MKHDEFGEFAVTSQEPRASLFVLVLVLDGRRSGSRVPDLGESRVGAHFESI